MYESTPITKSGKPPALMRLDWNKKDSNYLATFHQDGMNVVILDIRVPAVPVFEMKGHEKGINAISWSPVSPSQLGAVGNFCKLIQRR
jgi:DDB1- and CUL4-associated factor 7